MQLFSMFKSKFNSFDMGSYRYYSIITQPKRIAHIQAHIVIAYNRYGHLLGAAMDILDTPSLDYPKRKRRILYLLKDYHYTDDEPWGLTKPSADFC